MKTKLLDSLRLALPRTLWGAVGIWCILGPIMLLNSRSASWELRTVLGLLVLLCYGLLLVICLRAKWDALKELVSETALAMCFMIIGLLMNEITGIFVAAKHKLMIVYAFSGFFIAELIRPKVLSDALDELKRKQTADPIQPATQGERSEERSSAGVITQKDEFTQEIAVHSNQLTARTLAEYETEQPRLMSAQAENQQLQEKIDNVRDHLEMNEVQLKQSTVLIQEAVGLSATLQREFAALKQQLVESEQAIETLQSAVKMQSESQGLSFENQRLQEESHRIQLTTSESRMQELARRNQEVSDRYEHLETEVADLNRRLKDSQSKDREIETARQPLANVEFREMIYGERQQQLEKRIVDLERELSKGMNQVQVRDDTLQRLRETERVCQELTEENRRLWEKVTLWQERLAASEASQRQVSLLRQQIYALQTEYARLMNRELQAQAEFAASGDPIAVSRGVPDFHDTMVMQTTANSGAELSLERGRLSSAKVHQRMPSAIAISETKSLNKGSQETRGDQSHSAVRIGLEKEEDANWVVWASVKRQWSFGAVAATVVVIAGAVITGVLGTKLSTSKDVVVAPETSFQEYTIEAVSEPLKQPAPETSSQEYTVEAVSRRQKIIAPRLHGTFETVRPTQVYDGPSENSAWIADISAGMKLNVVDSTFGWLEIRSMHGRPRGFVRQEAAVSVARN